MMTFSLPGVGFDGSGLARKPADVVFSNTQLIEREY